MSTETRLLVEKEVRDLVQGAYENAKYILTTNEEELHLLAKALLEHETLTGKQIKEMLANSKKSMSPTMTPVEVSAIPTSVSSSPSPSIPSAAAAAASPFL